MVALMRIELTPESNQGVGRLDLVAAVLAGDRAAREEFAAEAGQSAFRFALQLLRNPEDARDISQEAVLRLLDSLDRVDPMRGARSWLYRIVRNLAIDLQRRNRVRRAQPIDDLVGADSLQLIDAQADPDRDLQKSRLQERIWLALESLPEQQSQILVLREYQDLSYREIAAVLEIAEGTVMSRLHAARKSLRSVLLSDGGVLEGGIE